MSKKDYQALARVIYQQAQDANYLSDGEYAQAASEDAIQRLSHAIASVLAVDNPRFDRARFIEACETGTTKGMRKAG